LYFDFTDCFIDPFPKMELMLNPLPNDTLSKLGESLAPLPIGHGGPFNSYGTGLFKTNMVTNQIKTENTTKM